MNPLLRSDPASFRPAIEAFAAATRSLGPHGLMVVHHGEVVAEQWWWPYTATSRQTVHSVSKTFLALAVGIAVDEGRLDLDTPVLDILDRRSPVSGQRAAQITSRHLLTMSSGHEIDTMDVMLALRDDDWVRIFFETPIPFEPGTHFHYNGGCSHVLAAVLQSVTGEGLVDYLTPRVFAPLGIDRPRWATSPAGLELGSSGLSVHVEDLAKLGQLFLDGGEWHGVHVVSKSWVTESARSHISTDRTAADWALGYGFHLWPSRYGYRADGAHGQFVIVLPDRDAVIAVTAGTPRTEELLDAVWNHLLPGLESTRPSGIDARNPAPPADAIPVAFAELEIPAFVDPPPAAEAVNHATWALPPNTLGIRALRVASHAESVTLYLESAEGEQAVSGGRRHWVSGMVDPWPYEPEIEASPSATRAGWVDSSTIEVHEQLTASAIRRIWRLSLRADGDLDVEFGTDLRFWNERRERMTATRCRGNGLARDTP